MSLSCSNPKTRNGAFILRMNDRGFPRQVYKGAREPAGRPQGIAPTQARLRTPIRSWVGAIPMSANLGRISRAGASPTPTIHGPGGLIRGLVGATLAVALGGGVWLKFALMGAIPCGRPVRPTQQSYAHQVYKNGLTPCHLGEHNHFNNHGQAKLPRATSTRNYQSVLD